MADNTAQKEFPPRRVVLLGASNLIRGISPVFEISRKLWGSPLDFITTAAHGRSYGRGASRVLWRVLPGILSCGIWDALEKRPPATTASLLTDIGNDLLFGASVKQIRGWVGECLEKVSDFSEKIIVTELPLETIKKLGACRFAMLRSMLFPSSRLQYQDAIERSLQLNDEVIELAKEFHAAIVKPRRDWYGFDPVHIRRGAMSSAWRKILSAWFEGEQSEKMPEFTYKSSLSRWIRLRRLRPHYRRMFGFNQRQEQPAARYHDDTCVSFY